MRILEWSTVGFSALSIPRQGIKRIYAWAFTNRINTYIEQRTPWFNCGSILTRLLAL
jgi:hypothetical protein